MIRNPKSPNYLDDLMGNKTEALCEGIFYHYTSAEGVKGILLSDNPLSLWFSRVEFLNDAEEGTDIFNTIRELLIDGVTDNKPFCDWVKSIQYNTSASFIKPQIAGNESTAECERSFDKMDTYICCFSENGDSLPMWNYYARGAENSGYSIGLSKKDLYDSILRHFSKRDYAVPSFYKVLYEDEEKKSVLRKLLEDFEYLFRMPGEDKDSLADLFNAQIQEMRYVFKNHHFRNEEEVRISIRIPSVRECNEHSVQYRSKAGFIIPYLVADSLNKDVVKTIRLGPIESRHGESKLKLRVLRESLEYKGFSGVLAQESEIPLRY